MEIDNLCTKFKTKICGHKLNIRLFGSNQLLDENISTIVVLPVHTHDWADFAIMPVYIIDTETFNKLFTKTFKRDF